MKNIAKILIAALLTLSMLPLAVSASEGTDTAWMEKLDQWSLAEYEKMTDEDLWDISIWLVHSDSDLVVKPAGIEAPNYYEDNLSFFEKYVPEERRANATILSLTPIIMIDATKAEIEYYARLDEVQSINIDEGVEIIQPPIVTYPQHVYCFSDLPLNAGALKESKDVTVTDPNGNILPDDAPVGTGYLAYNETYRYTVVVAGDTNGDGIVSTIDYLNVVASVTSGTSLDSAYSLAADFNRDASVTAADCLAMKTLLRK